jgi:hypothetical protein
LDEANAKYPTKRSGVAQHYKFKDSWDARDVLNKKVTVPRGSIVVWARRNSWTGHIGFTTKDWSGKRGNTIEGNTTTLIKGGGEQERAGGYVAEKRRAIEPYNYWRIVAFTRVEYNEEMAQNNHRPNCDKSHHVRLLSKDN